MESIKLEVKTREAKGKENKSLRKNNLMPAVVYGRDFKPLSVAVNYHDFERVFQQAGESSLVDLKVDSKNPIKVIIQEIQTDPKTDRFIHADFHQVKMTEKITTEVGLNFVGESKAVKDLGGVLIKNLDKVEVECLPGDLIHEIEVDLSKLNTFEDIIYVRDLAVPEKIKLLEKEDEAVAKVVPPRTDEELKALEEKVEEEVEKVEGVKEEEKPAEEEGEKEEEVGPAEAEKEEKETK